jgi:hypothetical protein
LYISVKRKNALDKDILWIYPESMETKKKRRGKSPGGSVDAKSDSLLLRLSPSEKQGFGEAASLSGLPLTTWMRERLRKIAKRELEEAQRPIPFLAEGNAPRGKIS